MATRETSDRPKIPIPPRFPRIPPPPFPRFPRRSFPEYAEYEALATEKLFKSAAPPRHLHDPSFVRKRHLPSGRKRVGILQARHWVGVFGALCHLIRQVQLSGDVDTMVWKGYPHGKVSAEERWTQIILATDAPVSKPLVLPDR